MLLLLCYRNRSSSDNSSIRTMNSNYRIRTMNLYWAEKMAIKTPKKLKGYARSLMLHSLRSLMDIFEFLALLSPQSANCGPYTFPNMGGRKKFPSTIWTSSIKTWTTKICVKASDWILRWMKSLFDSFLVRFRPKMTRNLTRHEWMSYVVPHYRLSATIWGASNLSVCLLFQLRACLSIFLKF